MDKLNKLPEGRQKYKKHCLVYQSFDGNQIVVIHFDSLKYEITCEWKFNIYYLSYGYNK